jgi:hypothetical protein
MMPPCGVCSEQAGATLFFPYLEVNGLLKIFPSFDITGIGDGA